jgi:ADP-ribosylglycohydrolase
MSETFHLELPLIAASQAQKHVTHNEALAIADAVIHLAVISRALASPPPSPSDGDRYLIAPGAGGAWVDT